ncbi:MAG: hypothetical protein EXS13_10595 [Planctomycetes bacterium]|nr:hypothetical protein [Planctomycetota bacterium]
MCNAAHWLALALVSAAGCVQLEPGGDVREEGLPEPDVFDVIRASNSKAAVDQLRDRHFRELEHARLLEARIGELIAAEEGLAAEHQERLRSLQQIQDQLRKLAEEQAVTARALEVARQSNAELEKALQEAQAKRAEIEAQAATAGAGKPGGG